MPTAKIVFFSRILDFTKNEDEIATIMGHEMGHVVAWHSKERMSHAFHSSGRHTKFSTMVAQIYHDLS